MLGRLILGTSERAFGAWNPLLRRHVDPWIDDGFPLSNKLSPRPASPVVIELYSQAHIHRKPGIGARHCTVESSSNLMVIPVSSAGEIAKRPRHGAREQSYRHRRARIRMFGSLHRGRTTRCQAIRYFRSSPDLFEVEGPPCMGTTCVSGVMSRT